jgi:hypothetical protein
MTRDIQEAPRRGDNKMHGFIHAEMSVAKLKRLSTSGLMLMSVPKGHGLPNARRKYQILKSWRKEGMSPFCRYTSSYRRSAIEGRQRGIQKVHA